MFSVSLGSLSLRNDTSAGAIDAVHGDVREQSIEGNIVGDLIKQ